MSEGGKEECTSNEITDGMGGSAKAFATRTRRDRAARNRTRTTARRADERRAFMERQDIIHYLKSRLKMTRQ